MAHEVAGVDRDGALEREQLVERGREHRRVDAVADDLLGCGGRGAFRRDAISVAAVALLPVDHGEDVARGGRDVAQHRRARPAGWRRAPPGCRRPARGSRRATSSPWRVVQAVSEAPQATTRSASAISSAARGVEKPPEMPSDQGEPVNRPCATAEVASRAPHRSASASRSARAPRAPRPATNTGRSASSSRAASSTTESASGKGGCQVVRAGTGPSTAGGGLHVEREVQDDGAALVAADAVGADDVRGGRGGRVDPLGHGADRADQGVLVDAEVVPHLGAGGVGGEHQQGGAATSPPR